MILIKTVIQNNENKMTTFKIGSAIFDYYNLN